MLSVRCMRIFAVILLFITSTLVLAGLSSDVWDERISLPEDKAFYRRGLWRECTKASELWSCHQLKVVECWRETVRVLLILAAVTLIITLIAIVGMFVFKRELNMDVITGLTSCSEFALMSGLAIYNYKTPTTGNAVHGHSFIIGWLAFGLNGMAIVFCVLSRLNKSSNF